MTTVCITLLLVLFHLIKRQKRTELPVRLFLAKKIVWSVTQAEEIRRQFPGIAVQTPKSEVLTTLL